MSFFNDQTAFWQARAQVVNANNKEMVAAAEARVAVLRAELVENQRAIMASQTTNAALLEVIRAADPGNPLLQEETQQWILHKGYELVQGYQRQGRQIPWDEFPAYGRNLAIPGFSLTPAAQAANDASRPVRG